MTEVVEQSKNKNVSYKLILRRHHKYANKNGYVLLHRYLKELDIGRYLEKWEIVHHIDEDITNNKPENLMIVTRSQHKTIHMIGKKYNKKNLTDRFCFICNSNKTYTDKHKWQQWYKHNNQTICGKCYMKRYYRNKTI